MPMTTRFAIAKVRNAHVASKRILTEEARREYASEVSQVADWWSNKIRASGRGGSHNAAMSRIESSISSSSQGKFFMRLGWLGSPPMAADGKTTWYVYQDTGYNAFGRGPVIPGLLLQMEARRRLNEGIRDANERIARRVEDEWGNL